jgi:hypothetical protein
VGLWSDIRRIFWDATWGNNIAAVEWVIITATTGVIGRRTLVRWMTVARDWLTGHLHHPVHETRKSAEAAHRIAADTYRHVTGQDHPDAPSPRPEDPE